MGFQGWLTHNWFDALQTLAIVVSFLTTGYTLREDRKARLVSNAFEITKQHRELWMYFANRPELGRIFEERPKSETISPAETEFINLVILHLKGTFQAVNRKLYDPPPGLRDDIRIFFNRPVARKVWEEKRRMHDPDFVAFVDDAIEEN